jgi:hypothetical protein
MRRTKFQPLRKKLERSAEQWPLRLAARRTTKVVLPESKERIIAPAADWQEVHFDWDNIGAGRAWLGIEALWHADSIYFDDVRVSNRSTDPMK